jgi:hypothetical protein
MLLLALKIQDLQGTPLVVSFFFFFLVGEKSGGKELKGKENLSLCVFD